MFPPCRLWPRRYLAPMTMCNSPSEPTSWTTRSEPQSSGPHIPCQRAEAHPPLKINQGCSLLGASHLPCRPCQAHGSFPPLRICSANPTLSWRSIRPTGTRVTSSSGGPRLVPGAVGKEGGRAEQGKPGEAVTSSRVPLQGGEEQLESQLGAIPPVPALPVQL